MAAGREHEGFLGESHEAADPRLATAFPALTDDQILALEPFGKRKKISKGGSVWSVGDTQLCMNVVVSGEMTVFDGRSGRFVATHLPGGFSGDIDVLSGRPVVVSATAATDLELLEIPGDCVRSIVGELPEIGDVILRAFLMRRALLQEMKSVGPLVVGSRFSGDTHRIREFLGGNRFPHAYEDLEENPETTRILDEFSITEADTPVVICPAGQVLRRPTNPEIAEALGITHPHDGKVYDLVVIGAGPAGLAAAVYGASEGLSTLVIDAGAPGGQAGTSSRIENYMGFPNGISGRKLADIALTQAEKFGAKIG